MIPLATEKRFNIIIKTIIIAFNNNNNIGKHFLVCKINQVVVKILSKLTHANIGKHFFFVAPKIVIYVYAYEFYFKTDKTLQFNIYLHGHITIFGLYGNNIKLS